MPSEIGLLTALTRLGVEGNAMDGTIPTQVGWMTAMEDFNTANNQFDGLIPSELGLLTGMVKLNLHENDLTGTMPTVLGLLTAVTELYVQPETHPHPPAPWFTSQGFEVGRCDAMSQASVQQRGAVRRSRQRGHRRHVVLHHRHRAGHRLPVYGMHRGAHRLRDLHERAGDLHQPVRASSVVPALH
jgi:hypothetical protein